MRYQNIIRAIGRTSALVVATVTALGASSPAANAALSSAPLQTVTLDGGVSAIARAGNTIYLGGDFSQVGPRTGPGAQISLASGQVDPGLPQVSGWAGVVFAVASDGSGGWYVGGNFTHVGGVPRHNLAHILSNKTVDPNWAPNPTDEVYALTVGPNGTVYVGGLFLSIGSNEAPRSFLAAIDPRTGDATPWAPNADERVFSIAVAPGGTVYVAGRFQTIGDQARAHIAAIDPATGHATAWNPNPTGSVDEITLGHDGTVYAAGGFTTIGSNQAARQHLAALDPATGAASAWNPNPATGTSCTGVHAVAIAPDNTVYVSGCFATIGANSVSRNGLAALDPVTGNATAWNPNPTGYYSGSACGGGVHFSTFIYDISVAADGTVYTAGNFTSIGANAASRSGLAALEPVTGNATAWNPNPNEAVGALALGPPGTIYAGGNFSSLGGVPRHNLAAINASDGSLTAWAPNPNDAVESLALGPTGTVYAGGCFTTIGANNASRTALAALDPATGNATAWAPSANRTVRAIQIGPDGTIYAGGDFTTIGANGALRNGIAALDPVTANASAWNPNPLIASPTGPGTGQISALLLGPSNTIYAGGGFTSIGANVVQRNNIAALDLNTANATPWNPNAHVASTGASEPGAVVTLAQADGVVYAGGAFTAIGANNPTRNHIGALDPASASATPWNPNVTTSITNAVPYLASIAAAPDGTIYAGGNFTGIGATPTARDGLAALDPTNGNATAWNAGLLGDAWVSSVLANSDGTLDIGGTFFNMDLGAQQGFAIFGPAATAPSNTAAPVAAGAAEVGQTLTCAPGSWSGTVVYYSYQWLRDGTPITDAARTFYDVGAADAGHSLTCQVTANNYDSKTSASSAAVAVPSPPGSTGGAGQGGAPPVVTQTGPQLTPAPDSSSRQPTSAKSHPRAGRRSLFSLSYPHVASRKRLLARGLSLGVRCYERCELTSTLTVAIGASGRSTILPALRDATALGAGRLHLKHSGPGTLRLRLARGALTKLRSPWPQLDLVVLARGQDGRITIAHHQIMLRP